MLVGIRPAEHADLRALHAVIERAYRGDSARQGWTHEADLLFDERTEYDTLASILETPGTLLLVAERESAPIGCVQITDLGNSNCYLGLLCIDPVLQDSGLGRQLIAAAEREAATHFGAREMEMTVIDQRSALIAYYERRGYGLTGERRPLPVDVVPPLQMVVLAKSIG